jgi:hypothetical protein
MQCPICRSEDFYAKSPHDEFDTIGFRVTESGVAFAPDAGEDPPPVGAATEVFCSTCAWHGKVGDLKPG